MGIRARLVLTFLVLSLLPLAVVGVLAYRNGQEAIQKNLGGSFQRMALSTIDKTDRSLYEAYHNVQTFSRLEVMQEVVTGDLDGKISAFLIGVARQYEAFSSFQALDKKGDVVSSSDPRFVGQSFAAEPFFHKAVMGSTALEDAHADPTEKAWVVTLAFPIRAAYDETETVGVLCARWRVSELGLLTQPQKESEADAGRSAVFLLRRDGLVLSAPASRKDAILLANFVTAGSQAAKQSSEGKSGFLVESGAMKQKSLVGFAASKGVRDFPGFGWSALVAQDARTAFAEIEQLKLLVLGVVVLVALVVSGLSLAVTKKITSPVLQISGVAERVRKGDLTGRVAHESRDEIGSLARIFNEMIADLKSQRERLVERHYVDSILSNMIDTLVVVDPEGFVKTANRATCELLGWHEDEIVGRPAARLLGESETDFREKRLKKLLQAGTGRTFDLSYVTRDGRRIPVTLSGSVLKDGTGTVQGFIFIAKDITEMKRAEEELQIAKEAAEQANRTKSQFLANMSHELRTPLNAIIGYSEMLQDEAEELDQDGFLPDLKKIQAAGKHLLALINDILDLSKIEAGRMELLLETIDISGLIHDTVTTVQPLIVKNENKLEIVIDGGPETVGKMRGDVTRIRQVLFNLLSNACKFTEKGTITLKAFREKTRDSEWIVFKVSDSGIGISQDQLGRLFQAFSQADASTSRKFGGTGLGLVISRRFCQIMGGDVTVESTYGSGTEFTVRLPAEVAESRPAAPEASGLIARPRLTAVAADPNAGTILVIDDDPNVQELLVRLAAKEGYRAAIASNGEEGIRLARELKPQMITLDVMMPGMDGWGVLAKLKAEPELAAIPVIMLTLVDQQNLGFALGAAEYLTKPVDRERLAAVLKKYGGREAARKILVVDDDEATRSNLRHVLVRDGYEVSEAENGRVALERVAENRPNLILLDLMMPQMDGFEFVAELRKTHGWKSIPIIVVSAMDVGPEERAKLQGGVEMVLKKGAYTREELEEDVRALIRSGGRTPSGEVPITAVQ